MKIYHVKGNPITLCIPLNQIVRTLTDGTETETESPFYPSGDVVVNLKTLAETKTYEGEVQENLVLVRCDDLSCGVYGLEILCQDQEGKDRRFYMRDAIDVVYTTADAGIEAGVEFDAETYTIDGSVFFYAKGDHGDLVLGIDHDKAFDGYFGNKLNNVLWSKDYQETVNGDAAFQPGIYTNITRGVPNWLEGDVRKWAPASQYIFFVVSGYNKDEDRYHIYQMAFASDKAQDQRVYLRHISWTSLYTWEGNPNPTFDEWVFLADNPTPQTLSAEVVELQGEQGSYSLDASNYDRIMDGIRHGKIYYAKYIYYGGYFYRFIGIEHSPENIDFLSTGNYKINKSE